MCFCDKVYFDGAIWYPQQDEFKTLLKVYYCHTHIFAPNTLCTQMSAWFLLDSILYCLVESFSKSKGGLSISVKWNVTYLKCAQNGIANTAIDVSNIFKSGETL